MKSDMYTIIKETYHRHNGDNKEFQLVIGGVKIDNYRLFMSVQIRGGPETVTDNKMWSSIGKELNVPKRVTTTSYMLKRHYYS